MLFLCFAGNKGCLANKKEKRIIVVGFII